LSTIPEEKFKTKNQPNEVDDDDFDPPTDSDNEPESLF